MILTLLIVTALLGALLAYIFPHFAYRIALTTTLVLSGLGVACLALFTTSSRLFQLVENHVWVRLGNLDVTYHVGVDGISLSLVLLTLLLGVVAVLVSKREIHTKEGAHYALLLLLVGAIVGVFISLHLVFFFLFWEAVLVLMFLFILVWGLENRRYAAMKFLVYTGIGSAALLFGILLLGVYGHSLDLVELAGAQLPATVALLTFGLLLFAFCVKMPVFPFHTWLPDAHVQAPTAGSILLAGVLLKMGAYGILRLCVGILPDVTRRAAPLLFAIALITILYGAWVCLAQRNLKRLIAYSSIHHMGIVLLGIAAGSTLGIAGAVFTMVSHGLLAALLFALAGVVHERTGTFDLDALHGLVQKMPRTSWLLVIGALGALGLPTMTGFIAEFLVFVSAFSRFGVIALLALLGVILGGGYILMLFSRAIFGRNDRLWAREDGVSFAPFVILLVATLLLGMLPQLLLLIIHASVLT